MPIKTAFVAVSVVIVWCPPAIAIEVPQWIAPPSVIGLSDYLDDINRGLSGASDLDYLSDGRLLVNTIDGSELITIWENGEFTRAGYPGGLAKVAIRGGKIYFFENGGHPNGRITESIATVLDEIRGGSSIPNDQLRRVASLDSLIGHPRQAAQAIPETNAFGRFAGGLVYSANSSPFVGMVFLDSDTGESLASVTTRREEGRGLGELSGLAFTNDGRLLASANDQGSSNSDFDSPDRRLQEFFLSADGGEWLRRDIDLGAIPILLQDQTYGELTRAQIKSIAVNPISQEVALINTAGELVLYDAELIRGTLVADHIGVSKGGTGQGIAFSADGKRLAVVDHDAEAVIEFNGLAGADLPGDYNRDGLVNAADYSVWRDSSGLEGAGLAADGDQNNLINNLDYVVWTDNYAIGHNSVDIPEPTSLAMTLGAVAVFLSHRLWRGQSARVGSARVCAISNCSWTAAQEAAGRMVGGAVKRNLQRT